MTIRVLVEGRERHEQAKYHLASYCGALPVTQHNSMGQEPLPAAVLC
jgi:hypothetical protein